MAVNTGSVPGTIRGASSDDAWDEMDWQDLHTPVGAQDLE